MTKVVKCPNCGHFVTVSGLGRKAIEMPVTKVCDALQTYRSVPAAAEKLGCSRALIYQVLKANGLTPAGVIAGLATTDGKDKKKLTVRPKSGQIPNKTANTTVIKKSKIRYGDYILVVSGPHKGC